ncbi:MAG: dnaA, partial [Alphaproteobacteria bacterium]|nr:dnaA [Alphaproteobacteria bacterium]
MKSELVREAATAFQTSGDALQSAWESIRVGLRRDCGARTFDGWLRPVALGGFDSDNSTLRLELPSQFMA